MVNPAAFLLAVSPLMVILILIAGVRLSLIRTGVAAWVWTAAVAILAFGAGPAMVAVSQAKALILALDVLPIVWGALLFYVVCEEAGVIQAVGDGLSRAVPWKGLRALTLAWAFASFLQGAGGFGVPVVITAPLLLAAGFTPLQAMSLPFIGHSWAVTFGSLGTSFQALTAASGLSADMLAGPSALLLGILCLLSGVLVALPASEKGEFRRLLPVLFAVGIAMAGTQYWLAVYGFWQIGSLGGGLAGLLVIVVAARILRGRDPALAYRPDRKFILGLSAYLVLIVVILCAQWIGPLRGALQSVVWNPVLPEAVTAPGFTVPAGEAARIAPFGHPGALLSYSAIAVFILFRKLAWYPVHPAGRILRGTVGRAVPVSIGILLMVGVSTILSYSGMTDQLAEGLTATVGGAFPAVAPWLGAVGAFLTGSNTNSNLMFAPLQQSMARSLGVREDILLAGQTGGGAVGSVLSPAKVGMGSVAFASGLKEGDLIRELLLPIGILLLTASIFTVLMVY
ncbi:MAG: L-lactate permease [Anaerolineales bacterium]|nr:L-lactate permease [Anaerolineales bacterium]